MVLREVETEGSMKSRQMAIPQGIPGQDHAASDVTLIRTDAPGNLRDYVNPTFQERTNYQQ
jgi:hypothetical protein